MKKICLICGNPSYADRRGEKERLGGVARGRCCCRGICCCIYGGGNGGTNGGFMKLLEEVQMCGYKDVEVMWNMLTMGLQPDQAEAPPVPNSSPTVRSRCTIIKFGQ
ncbi:unnamed protein product [Lupinus luteus]|uniref:Uncharacterized protein n=1 Tax=Lupinus luteus TaxID=3873 RepID=A0AAV1Y9T6_LUPLU